MEGQSDIITIVVIGISLAVPLLWSALGELVAEQSGVINPGIEGVLLAGALVAMIVYFKTDSLALALLATAGFGALCGLALGYLYISRSVDQIVTGILFNLVAIGATTALFVDLDYLSGARVETTERLDVLGLGDISVIGPIIFNQDAFVYSTILVVAAVWVLMRRTWLGVSIRAAGEHPEAVEAAGLNVWRLRYLAMIVGCMLPALGGAVLVISIVGAFTPVMSAGTGFIALGVVVLARWNPLGAVVAALLFGITQAFQFEAQRIEILSEVPVQVWLALPYIVTIVAVMFARGSQYPRAAGAPYPPPSRRRWISELLRRLPLAKSVSTSQQPERRAA